ncbi:MAG TPA: prepilin-type N-terminal cleavage/methylation domain-containing protein [Polyangia bacterium]|nr:prepilin-type N-terminal cleavage/methylation domain-containing protein [Polyangia bacterium]
MRWRGAGGSGFTVIEVMVAILILAVSVTAIFGAQYAAVVSVEYSRGITAAVQLARCKMSEIELEFLTEGGFEEGDATGSGECCEATGGEAGEYSCRWEIKRIELPDPSQMMAAGGLGDDLDGAGDDDAAGGMLGGMGMEAGLISSLAPMITGLLEEAIRRVTVTVEWQQGNRERQLEIVQYVTHPTQGPLELMQQSMLMRQLEDDAALQGGGVLPDGSGGGNAR